MPATRRLAAIFATDVVGYSRLMGEDEEGTLDRLKAHRRDLIDPKIAEHRGRIVKTTGDGLLAEFGSVVDAVRCAVEIQRGMIERDTNLPEDQRIRFRLGINLGDIIIDRGDIFGDGVNVAARLEALAEPGAMCISGTVRDHVGDRLPYPFADMGLQSVKNIARPVRVYALSAAAVAETPLVRTKPLPRFSRARAEVIGACLTLLIAGGLASWWGWPKFGSSAVAAPARLSIAVLPFANLSNDPTQDRVVDAVTDDLTSDLSHIVESFVVSRTSAYAYKGKAVDAKQIGHDLGVRYVLEGSLQRANNEIQVNVQLINADSGAHVWADRFGVDDSNPEKAQAVITGRLARSIRLELTEDVGKKIEREEPKANASDLILLGWAFYFRPQSATNLDAAMAAFEQALQLAPKSVAARDGIATILGEKLALGWSKARDEDTAKEDSLLRDALDLDNNDVNALSELGRLRRIQNRLPESKIALERVLALDPDNFRAVIQLGITLIYLGHPADAIPYFERSRLLNATWQNSYFTDRWQGECELLLRNLDDALLILRRGHLANPRAWYTHLLLAATLGLKGDVEEARSTLADLQKAKPEISSLEKLREINDVLAFQNNPQYASLREETIYAGLLAAGLPAK